MKQFKYLYFILLIIFTGFTVKAQVYPVTVNTFVQAPYSVYLNDYLIPSRLSATLVFTDYNESLWDVKLRLTIESNRVKIQTLTDYFPSAPITLIPGTPVQITGTDFAQALDYNNVSVLGFSKASLIENGKLPEGFYTFCVEALDYRTGKVLSKKSCASVWIKLNDEPITISPVCGSVIKPSVPQSIFFQWQRANNLSANSSSSTEYQLTIYELTDLTVNPLNAIASNKVLKIFESGFSDRTSYFYGPSDPILDLGKRYVYTVQAKEVDGKDIYKNNGVSQACWFNFGYPQNGFIALKYPEDKSIISRKKQFTFKWSSPNNLVQSQQFSYHFKIVQIQNGQTPEEALALNPAWYEERTLPTTKTVPYEILVAKKPEALMKYAWQVTSSSDGQSIAQSPIYTFEGPSLLEEFNAGNHVVYVNSTSNNNFNSLSGTGSVKIAESGELLDVTFSKLVVKNVAGRWVLQQGEIYANLPDTMKIELTPDLSENTKAYFYPELLRLNDQELALQGVVKWPFPHPVVSGDKPFVTSVLTWLNFDTYKVSGKANLSTSNRFELLDPYNFAVDFSTASDFLIKDNLFYLRFDGKIELPESIKSPFVSQGKVEIPFKTNQMFYIPAEAPGQEGRLVPVRNTKLYLDPVDVIIDLSELQSPGQFKDIKDWKGVYFNKFNLVWEQDVDKFRQVLFDNQIIKSYEVGSSDSLKAFVVSSGLNLLVTQNSFAANVKYNSFPSVLTNYHFEIENSSVNNSFIKGTLLIPFISTTQPFSFTSPVNSYGIQPGYLTDLDNTSFVFNKGNGEQEIKIDISRAVFSDRERIDMTLDMEWPFLGITMKSIPGFKAWGNYNIGFNKPNGIAALSEQVAGRLSDFPVTIDFIGAGRSAGAYAFGTSAKIVMGADVSGSNGAPVINMYSIAPNSLLPKDSIKSSGQSSGLSGSGEASTAFSIEEAAMDVESEILNDLRNANFSFKGISKTIVNAEEEVQEGYSIGEIASVPKVENVISLEQDQTISNIPKGFRSKLNQKQQKILDEIIETVVMEITSPITDSINVVSGRLNKKIADKINSITDTVNVRIETSIRRLMDTLAIAAIKKIKNDKYDISDAIHNISDLIAKEVSGEITSSIKASVSKNITMPITSFIRDTIAGRINTYIHAQVTVVIYDLMDGQKKADDVLAEVGTGAGQLLDETAKKIIDQVDFSKLKSTISNTANDIVAGINTRDIMDKLIDGIAVEAGNIAKQVVLDKLGEKGKEAFSQLVGQNTVDALADAGISMDFTNLGDKIRNGDIKGIVKVDPSNIAVNTKFVSFKGAIYYTADDPVYGDVWKGDIDFKVKVPKEFNLNGIYLNGRKNDYSFWFCQI
ncbi:MAG TPA: hypothetical protein VIK89_07105, partial [Cytophagaceae bacterium]